ncbi:ethylene-responsive transcription factor [Trifolium repens]|nr:ethylene-responsive transcription factor [Trifolium repens]
MCFGIAKLVFAPRNRIIFSSEALVASKAVLKVPNQTRAFFEGSLISAAYRPHGRFLTQRHRIFVSGVGVSFDGVRILFFVRV